MKLFRVSSSHWDLTQRHLYVEEALLLLSGLLTFLITLVPVIDKCLSFLSFFHLFGCAGCCLRHMGSSFLNRDGTWPLALGVWSLSPWTTREVPDKFILIKNIPLWLWNYSFILMMIKTILWELNTTSECLQRPLLEKRPVSTFFCKYTFLL